MFTTEGHIISVDKRLRELPWKEFFSEDGERDQEEKFVHRSKSQELRIINSSSNVSCFFHCIWKKKISPFGIQSFDTK